MARALRADACGPLTSISSPAESLDHSGVTASRGPLDDLACGAPVAGPFRLAINTPRWPTDRVGDLIVGRALAAAVQIDSRLPPAAGSRPGARRSPGATDLQPILQRDEVIECSVDTGDCAPNVRLPHGRADRAESTRPMQVQAASWRPRHNLFAESVPACRPPLSSRCGLP